MAIETDIADLVFFAGDDWPTIPFAVVDANSAAVSIAGYTGIEFTVYEDAARTCSVFQKTLGDGVTRDAGTGGTGTVDVTAADTADMEGNTRRNEARTYYWDVQAILADGKRRTLGFGTIPVRQ